MILPPSLSGHMYECGPLSPPVVAFAISSTQEIRARYRTLEIILRNGPVVSPPSLRQELRVWARALGGAF